MSLSCRYAASRCARQIRRTPSDPLRTTPALAAAAAQQQQQRITRRYQSAGAAAAAPTSPKIAGIVDQISQLTLLETADLVTSLKVRETNHSSSVCATRRWRALRLTTVLCLHRYSRD